MDALYGIGAGWWPPAQAPGRASTWTYTRAEETITITITATAISLDGHPVELRDDDLTTWFMRQHVDLHDAGYRITGHTTRFEIPMTPGPP